MGSYFSFDRMITRNFVRALYFIGFLVLTFGGFALAIWAAFQLNDASIDRQLGWRYVAIGAGAVILGNVVWRVFCELWVVLFNMHARLVSLDYNFAPSEWVKVRKSSSTLNLSPKSKRTEARTEVPATAEARTEIPATANETYDSRGASVLGLT